MKYVMPYCIFIITMIIYPINGIIGIVVIVIMVAIKIIIDHTVCFGLHMDDGSLVTPMAPATSFPSFQKQGWEISNETLVLDDVFPPDDIAMG